MLVPPSEVEGVLSKHLYEIQDELGAFEVAVSVDPAAPHLYRVGVCLRQLDLAAVTEVASIVNEVERQLLPGVALALEVKAFAETAEATSGAS